MDASNLPNDLLGKKEYKFFVQNLSDGEKLLSVCKGARGQAVILTDKKIVIV